jgi:hypothetical protein
MVSIFLCKCTKEDNFQIIREHDRETEELIKIYFRCSECGRDYSLEEIKAVSYEGHES